MKTRLPLQPHTMLSLEDMKCEIECVIGCDTNAIIYQGKCLNPFDQNVSCGILIKELFPLYPKGKIFRNEKGMIIVFAEASKFFEREKRIFNIDHEIYLHHMSKYGKCSDAFLNSISCRGTLYTVLFQSNGRNLQKEMEESVHDLHRASFLMIKILEALETFHTCGYLHLHLCPSSILLTGEKEQEQVILMDCRNIGTDLLDKQIYFAPAFGYSSPEMEIADVQAITPASDLYSAAAIFYQMLMGRPLTLQERLQAEAPNAKDSPYLKNMTPSVQKIVYRILRKGMNILPQRRYQSAAEMAEDFRDILRQTRSV